jgi:TrmH family RNA methyltransferase
VRIESPANPRVRAYKSLATGKGRRERGRFQLEGLSLIDEALRAGVAPEAVFWCPERAESGREASLIAALPADAEVFEVTERVLEQMSSTVTPQPIAAEARIPDRTLHDLELPKQCLIAAPFETQDPGNLGTMVRTAHAVSATALVALGNCVDAYSPKVVRATMGSLFHFPVIRRAQPAEFLGWCRANRVEVVAATVHTERSLFGEALPERTALLLGGETQGLPEELVGSEVTRVAIPMPGGTESLNVAVAAAVMMYEYRRQRPR